MRPLSHSSLNVYLTCPRRYKFRYVDKLPELPRAVFSFGKSVHATIKFLWELAMEGAYPQMEQVLAYYKRNWIREGYSSIQQERFLFLEGRKMVCAFFEKHSRDNNFSSLLEHRFQFDVGGVPVVGYIDRVDLLEGGRAVVLDYKTGKDIAPERVWQDPQLTLYQLACEDTLSLKVELLALYHLDSLTVHSCPARGADQLDSLKKTIVEIAGAIAQERFEPVPSASNCRFCDYKNVCECKCSGADES